MNWTVKARLQSAIAAMPMADTLYYAMQRSVGGLRPRRNPPERWFQPALNMRAWALAAGQSFAGKRFLEVGTGRALGLPTALWLLGAQQIVTVDLNRYMKPALVAECNHYLREHRDRVQSLFPDEVRTPLFHERFAQLISFNGSLNQLLRLMNIEYLAPADASRLPVSCGSFDFHVSCSVLEHIPGPVISEILLEAQRVLVPNGLLIHIIDPSDHFSHEDPSVTAINFLQFDDAGWQRWGGNRFMYHNRLRACEHLRLWQQAGVRVLRASESVDQDSLRALESGFPVAERFRGFTPNELAVRTVRLLGTFSPTASVAIDSDWH